MRPLRARSRSGIAFGLTAFTTTILILLAAQLRAEDQPAQADATKAAHDEIERVAAEKKAERAEQAKLQRRAAREVPARRPGGGTTAAIALEQRRARQRQLDAAFRGRPVAVAGQMLAGPRPPLPMMPRPGFGGPGPMPGPGQPRFQNFQWPNGGGFIMRWGGF